MILSNQARCLKCMDAPFSRNRHDYVSCKCGAMAVDGGMDYLRRTATDFADVKEMSIEINGEAYAAAVAGVRWALDNKRNELGIISAVTRAFRDNGVAIFNIEPGEPIEPNGEAEWELEQAAFHAAGRADVPEDVQKLVGKLWREVVNRETAVIAMGCVSEPRDDA